MASGLFQLDVDLDFFPTLRLVESGLEYRESGRDSFRIVEGDPLSASVRSTWTIEVGRAEWRTRVETVSTLSADALAFLVTNEINAFEGDSRICAKMHAAVVPRENV